MTIDVVRDMTRVVDALSPEQAQTLDHWSEQLQGFLNTLIQQGGPAGQRVKNWLNGVWLGHPLHPALTDATIGAWSTGAILDLVGATDAADAAMTVGVLCAVPTAISGAADFVDSNEEPRRLGLLHAILNSAGLTLIAASLFARRSNRRALGIGLSTTGLTLASVAAWLGGDMVYRFGMSVSRIAFQPRLDEFQVVARSEALEPGKLVAAETTVDGVRVPIALIKKGTSVLAFSGLCPHWGGPMAEGKVVDDDCVECPWHRSQFNMHDGTAVQGPASEPLRTYEVRVRNGNVEVRSRT